MAHENVVIQVRRVDGGWEAKSPEYAELGAFEGRDQREAVNNLLDAIEALPSTPSG